jgi:pyruvate/2-oxoglutarate dehydrogenase complex dihydrolipoamide acyltransferase (E2) component
VETAKAITKLPSPATGILREITVRENQAVPAGARLAVIEPDFDHGY